MGDIKEPFSTCLFYSFRESAEYQPYQLSDSWSVKFLGYASSLTDIQSIAAPEAISFTSSFSNADTNNSWQRDRFGVHYRRPTAKVSH